MMPIIYGVPGLEIVTASQRGEVELGGCCVSDDLPMFRCGECGRTSGRLADAGNGHFSDETWR